MRLTTRRFALYTLLSLYTLVSLSLVASLACGSPAGESHSGSAEEAIASGPPVSAAGLTFHLPQSWQQEAPSSQMRLAQATIPGDGGPGQLAVFFFGAGGGGGVEANLERWKAQVAEDPGSGSSREQFAVGDFLVTWIEVTGTLKASQIGSFPPTDQPGHKLLGAVIEGSGGPWFFKAVGPSATMDQQRGDFVAMLRSARPASGQPAAGG